MLRVPPSMNQKRGLSRLLPRLSPSGGAKKRHPYSSRHLRFSLPGAIFQRHAPASHL